ATAQQYAQNAVAGDATLRVDDATKHLHLLAGWGNAVMTITSTSVGIGTPAPNGALEIHTPGAQNYPARFQDIPNNSAGIMLQMTVNSEIDVAGLKIGGIASTDIESGNQSALYLNQSSNNGVVIGGNVTVSGTIYANYQDVAEWVPASESM